eukprot:TRINITY_DN6287_c0_g1_i1.p1 TRINITY_DN6287_c0_g1~~TRINITY_DN6287_c0_g1_i1.p1  ORF type:complete len:413 (-),score=87.33 TRINITY_DN6287_c0_g1_i1:85-1323(-)
MASTAASQLNTNHSDLTHWIGKSIHELRTPAFIVNKSKTKRNCEELLERVKRLGLEFRPHVKTHKTVEGAKLQLGWDSEHDQSNKPIIVSTLSEGRFFVENGFQNILYAVPISPDKLPECAVLNTKITHFHLMVDSITVVMAIDRFFKEKNLSKKFSVFLAVDAGYGREGVPVGQQTQKMAKFITTQATQSITLEGIYSHSGHSYAALSQSDLTDLSDLERKIMAQEAEFLKKENIEIKVVSVGATPSALSIPQGNGITEVHAGNYLWLDCQQSVIGNQNQTEKQNQKLNSVGCHVLSRVLSVYPDRGSILIDAGALALSKDLAREPMTGYGQVVGHPNLELVKVTQEVGVLVAKKGQVLEVSEENFPIGSFLKIVPNHSCLTSACFTEYFVVDGEKDEETITEVWKPCRGW